jgi:septal ring-binding cell division protein DamX
MAHEVPISGQIDPKSFPFLLMDLHRNAATGSLKVDGPTYQKALYFRSGRILFGSSNDPRDQLGAILIEGGKISPEQLEDINTKVGPGSPLAKVLSDSGFVSQRELSEAARAKVEQILSDVLGYTTGSFEFEDGVLPKGAVDLKLSSERLVLAAARRVSDRAFVLRHLGSLEVVLAPSPDPQSLMAEIHGEMGGLMDALDGRVSLKEAAAQTRLDEFDAAKIACALLFLNLVERVEPQKATTPVPDSGTARTLPDIDRTARVKRSDAGRDSERTLADEPLADPAAFAPEPEPPTVIVNRPTPAPVIAKPAPRVEPEPTVIASARTIIAPAPELPISAPTVPMPTAPRPTPRPSPTTFPVPIPSLPSVEEKPSPEPRRSSRASAADMAAVDALLNSRGFEGPLEPLEKPSEPQRVSPRPERARASRAPSSSGPGPVAVVGLLLVAAAIAGAVWFFVIRPRGPAAVVAQAPPQTVKPAPPTTPLPVATTTLTTEPVVPVTEPPAPVPTPVPKASHKEPTTHGGRKSLEDARGLMTRGELGEAAEAFAANVRGSREAFTIQIMVACSDESVQKAVASGSAPELYILPVHYKGKSCYRLCWGVYDNEGRADSAARSVPEYFRRGGASPKVVRTSAILP